MLFSSYSFLLLFLPITVILFHVLKKLFGNLVSDYFIILISLLFYGFYYRGYLLILTMSIVFNILIANILDKSVILTKWILGLGMIFNICNLFIFYNTSYFNLHGSAFPQNVVALQILMPLGVSFLTFHQLSFLIGVYKKEYPPVLTREYLIKTIFFPNLVVGPLYQVKASVLNNKEHKGVDFDGIAYGLILLVNGLFKMVVLADSFYIYVFNGTHIENPGLIISWLTMISYTFQIYFYLSGCCDLAVGIGKMFGLSIPYNFLSPLKSKSITEFTSRWHIGLVSILNEIKEVLQLNNQNKFINALMLLGMSLLGSMWFGTTKATFLFGLVYGILLAFESIFTHIRIPIPSIIKRIITFLIINLLLLLLASNDLSYVKAIYQGLINFNQLGLKQLNELTKEGSLYFPNSMNGFYFWLTFGISFIVSFFTKNTKERMNTVSFTISSAILMGIMFLISIIYLTRLEFLF